MINKFILAAMLVSFIGINAQTTPVFEMVKDINPSGDSMPTDLINYNSKIFFTADDGVNGRELWITDGTETKLLKDINPGENGSDISNFKILNGKLLFTATDDANGNELWTSDGTVAGTKIVKDMFPGSGGSYAFEFIEFQNALYFRSEDGVHGTELWKTDGTEVGTVMIGDLRTGEFGSNPSNFTVLNNKLYFSAMDGFDYDNGQTGLELWVSDGTAAGTHIVKDINPIESSGPSSLTTFGNKIYFSADDGTNGTEIWATDGTEAGTYMVKDISNAVSTASSLPAHFIAFNGKLIFSAYTPETGREMWTTDGTADGTHILKDVKPGTAGAVIPQFRHFIYKDKLLLTLDDNTHGAEIWTTDGTTDGTQLYLDVFPGSDGSMNPNQAAMTFAEVNGTLYFRGLDNYDEYYQLWKSDGTAAGTKKLMPDPTTPYNFALAQIPGFTALGNKLYFRAQYNDSGYELWSVTTDAAMAVTDFNKTKFRVYPNPASDVVNISGDSKISSVQVYDLSGKVLSNQTSDSKQLQMNVSDLPKGNYIIKVLSDGKSSSHKIIKK
ncbi:ELWxxDGT repeat protein [Chryseobacterium sp. FH1]|uniref:ELWxxDGT repeat protein n=1 Tax=Chryseobacterium sp. FH1 TaxID=1233951 RepID=UPI0006905EEB|nr:ELWxxDGT repeat protein [Chryseobacterium sp. FH1]